MLDEPTPGTAFVAVEGRPDADRLEVSVWSYLYGEEAQAVVDRDRPRWAAWLADRAADDGEREQTDSAATCAGSDNQAASRRDRR